MPLKVQKRILSVFSVAVFLFSVVADAGTIEWTFPRLGSCHEGLPFADGVTGVLAWGGGDTVNLTIGRGDLWDHRGGYPWTDSQSYSNIIALVKKNDGAALKALFSHEIPKNWNPDRDPFTDRYNPYMLPFGRIELKIPGGKLVRGALDPATGLGTLILSDGREISLVMSKASHIFAMKFPKGLEVLPRVIPSTDFPIFENKLRWRGFEKAQKRGKGFLWRLPSGESVSLSFDLSECSGGKTLRLWTSCSWGTLNADALDICFDALVEESKMYWKQFWSEGARVVVPDRQIQEVFDFGMYKFGAMTDPDGIPAGLQGQWLEDDRLVPWNGDYHFNINVQECYSPAFRGGHFQNLMPLFRMVLSWRSRLRDNARKFVGIEDGYVLPHSVDDRGVCIGGFWTGTIDHASTAWIADFMFRYVKYSGDIAFLKKDGYDFMKGAMNVYLAMMEERNGQLSIPLGPSPEWGGSDVRRAVGRDPSFQLAAAHRLSRDLIAAARMLTAAPDPRWHDVENRLPQYSSGPEGISLFDGQPFVQSHRHHSHLAGLYPFDTLPLSDPTVFDVVRKTYDNWIYKGTGEWTGWCVPWASIIHTHLGNAEAAAHALHSWKTFFNNPGHGSLHDAFYDGYTVMMGRPTIMQMDGQCASVAAVLEMMAHEIEGKTIFFRGCPESWQDVAFENLALSDGTRVNGRRSAGVIEIVRVQSRKRSSGAEK